jgi:hypothetical protein
MGFPKDKRKLISSKGQHLPKVANLNRRGPPNQLVWPPSLCRKASDGLI